MVVYRRMPFRAIPDCWEKGSTTCQTHIGICTEKSISAPLSRHCSWLDHGPLVTYVQKKIRRSADYIPHSVRDPNVTAILSRHVTFHEQQLSCRINLDPTNVKRRNRYSTVEGMFHLLLSSSNRFRNTMPERGATPVQR